MQRALLNIIKLKTGKKLLIECIDTSSERRAYIQYCRGGKKTALVTIQGNA